jgi:hypothetical protein
VLLRKTIIAALALVLACAWQARANGYGGIYITTLPPGATVWVDGRYLGETPLYVDGLEGGRHVILLTRAGWQPLNTSADVTVGRVSTLSAVLSLTGPGRTTSTPAKGSLLVRDAQGTKVYVDGTALAASSEAVTLSAGQHILAVVRGTTRSVSSFTIYPDTITTISLAPKLNQNVGPSGGSEDVLASLVDYVPANDFVVNGDDITIHYKNIELECTVGSLTYVLNGKPGTLTVAPEMVGDKPFLPVSLLNRLAGSH